MVPYICTKCDIETIFLCRLKCHVSTPKHAVLDAAQRPQLRRLETKACTLGAGRHGSQGCLTIELMSPSLQRTVLLTQRLKPRYFCIMLLYMCLWSTVILCSVHTRIPQNQGATDIELVRPTILQQYCIKMLRFLSGSK